VLVHSSTFSLFRFRRRFILLSELPGSIGERFAAYMIPNKGASTMLANALVIVMPIEPARAYRASVSSVKSQRGHYSEWSQKRSKQSSQKRGSPARTRTRAGHNVRYPTQNQKYPAIIANVDVHFRIANRRKPSGFDRSVTSPAKSSSSCL
jgi:hypothetical protein